MGWRTEYEVKTRMNTAKERKGQLVLCCLVAALMASILHVHVWYVVSKAVTIL